MSTKATVIELCPSRPLRLLDAIGTEVVAVSGTVWITVCGMAEDIFIEAGQRYRIDSGKLVLIEAIEHAEILLDAPPPAGWALLWQRLTPPAASTARSQVATARPGLALANAEQALTMPRS